MERGPSRLTGGSLYQCNVAFYGYDHEREAVVLKDVSGELTYLQPVKNSASVAPVRRCDTAEEDDDESFVESECSDSYVSSASTTCSASVAEVCSCENRMDRTPEMAKACPPSLELAPTSLMSLPKHGTLLSTKVLCGIDLDASLSPYVLGYDEEEDVFIFVPPRWTTDSVGLTRSRDPSRVIRMPISVLSQCFHWQDALEGTSPNGKEQAWEPPLSESFMVRPSLDQQELLEVFGVSPHSVHRLAALSTEVEFLGAAWGIPWVKPTRSTGVDADPSNRLVPLSLCHDNHSLREVYGLCEQVPDSVHCVAVPDVGSLGGLMDGVEDGLARASQSPVSVPSHNTFPQKTAPGLHANQSVGEDQPVIHCGAEASTNAVLCTNTLGNTSVGSDSEPFVMEVETEKPCFRANEANFHISETVGEPAAPERRTEVDGRDADVAMSTEELTSTTSPTSPFFTAFLKAVVYWKMGLLSSREQREHPLAFVEYYATNAHDRIVEAVELLHTHRHRLASVAGVHPSLALGNGTHILTANIGEIVRVLVELEGLNSPQTATVVDGTS
ncbi:hypothetical protein ERJ75_000187800 [Trypanosoma vivax]|nr:hypothetical protein ERJ75_000187800 [Trypanosoma vivax]